MILMDKFDPKLLISCRFIEKQTPIFGKLGHAVLIDVCRLQSVNVILNLFNNTLEASAPKQIRSVLRTFRFYTFFL